MSENENQEIHEDELGAMGPGVIPEEGSTE